MTGHTNVGGIKPKKKTEFIEITGVSSYEYTPTFQIRTVMLMFSSYSGEMRTPMLMYKRLDNGTWTRQSSNAALHNYYDGSGGSDYGQIRSVTDEKISLTGLTTSMKYWLVVTEEF